jgi:hypothetical protein
MSFTWNIDKHVLYFSVLDYPRSDYLRVTDG